VTTSLNSVTDSVGWQDPKIITDNIYPGEPTVMGLAYSQQTLATVWVDGSIEIQFASLPPDRISQIEWSNPINISTRQGHESRHPHAVLGLDGYAHVVWSEEGKIWYSRCQTDGCMNLIPTLIIQLVSKALSNVDQ
jgi:hypothetical protein